MSVHARADLSENEADWLAQLDPQRVLRDIRWLSQEVINPPSGAGKGSIIAGSSEEQVMAEAIAKAMSDIGLQVTQPTFPVRTYRYGEVTLKVGDLAIEAVSMHTSTGTWGSDNGAPYRLGNREDGRQLQSTLIDAGDGYREDYERVGDIRGRVVLVRRGLYWPTLQISEAVQRGAAAILLYDFPFAREDAIKQDSIYSRDDIPVLSIAPKDAEQIKQALALGPQEVLVENRIDSDFGRSRHVIGTLRGSELPDQWIVVSAHYDRWWDAASDNSAGVAAALELARFLLAGGPPRHSVMFLAVGAEEGGQDDSDFDWAAGSYAFVKDFPHIVGRSVMFMNIDMFGWTANTKSFESTPELAAKVNSVINDLGLSGYSTQVSNIASSGDAWVYAMVGGSSVMNLHPIGDAEAQSDYLQYYHTQLEVFRERDFQNVSRDLRLSALALARMDAAGFADVRLDDLANWIEKQAAQDASRAPASGFGPLAKATASFRDAALRAQAELSGSTVAELEARQQKLINVRKRLKPWLFSQNADYGSSLRSSIHSLRYQRIREALDQLAVSEQQLAGESLAGIPGVTQMLWASPDAYARERVERMSSGDWSNEFDQLPPDLSWPLVRACRILAENPSSKRMAEARLELEEALTIESRQLEEALQLMTVKLEAAASALDAS